MEVNGWKIKCLLYDKEMSQGDLAKRAGVSSKVIWKAVRQNKASQEMLEKIASALWVEPEELLKEVE